MRSSTRGCACAVCRSVDPRNQRLRPSILVEGADIALLVDATPDFRTQALREDIRYRPSRGKSFAGRLRYAALHSLLASVPGGNLRPAYSRMAAAAGTELIVAVWSPYRVSAASVLQGTAFTLLGAVENSYLSEFEPDLKQFARRLRNRLLRRPSKE